MSEDIVFLAHSHELIRRHSVGLLMGQPATAFGFLAVESG
jgi:hypothetical protein